MSRSDQIIFLKLKLIHRNDGVDAVISVGVVRPSPTRAHAVRAMHPLPLLWSTGWE